MDTKRRKIIDVQFYKSDTGSIPVKEGLKKLTAADRKNIGDDIRTVEFGWPIGMPLVGKIDTGLWEVRSNLSNNRISRVLFTVYSDMMVPFTCFYQKDLKNAQERSEDSKTTYVTYEKGENK